MAQAGPKAAGPTSLPSSLPPSAPGAGVVVDGGGGRPVPVATRGAGGRAAAAAMGSWAAATWRLGGCSGRGGLRGVPRRRSSSRPGRGDRAATLKDLLQSSVEAEESGAAAAAAASTAAAARQERRSPREGTVLLFPGQGSQFVGMGRGLLRYPGVRDMYRLAEKVLGYDLLSLCLEGPRDELDRTRHCQPAVFVASLAAVEKLNHQQPEVRGRGAVGEAGLGRAGGGGRSGPLRVRPGPRRGPGPHRAAVRRLPQGPRRPLGSSGGGWEKHGPPRGGRLILGLGSVSVQVVESCVAAAGYSVGEFAALVFAGALGFAEGGRGMCGTPE